MYSVCVITPTTFGRSDFNIRIREQIEAQDYGNFVHAWNYEQGTVGEKRNALCAASDCDIILHADSDDSYAPDWITKSVEALVSSGAALTGLSTAYFKDIVNDRLYLYQYPKDAQPYVCGATMCYWRKTWERNPFPNVKEGEDRSFCARAGKIFAHDYTNGFIANLHGANTCSHRAIGSKEFTLVR